MNKTPTIAEQIKTHENLANMWFNEARYRGGSVKSKAAMREVAKAHMKEAKKLKAQPVAA